MSAPTRYTSGITQSASWQPLGAIGTPNPFFYAEFADDFLPYRAGDYTVTAAGGSVAASAVSGTGGRILLTTGGTASNFASLQQPTANFAYVGGYKLAFLTRINMTDVDGTALIAGLVNTTNAPFTGLTDGIYFSKVADGNTVLLNVKANNVVIASIEMPSIANSSALIDGADQDLGFYVDSQGNVKGFMGYHLIGQKNQNHSALGPNATIFRTDMTGSINTLPINPTVAIQTNAAAAQTASIDFLYAAQER